MAKIPNERFDLLVAAGCLSTRALAQVGQATSGDRKAVDVEYCPHCGEAIRFRRRWSAAVAKVVNEWIREQSSKPSRDLAPFDGSRSCGNA
jgi:hypothetical protein